MKGNRREDVYREALRLHKISWQKRTEKKYFWQKDSFDTSHLPEGFDNPTRWEIINELLYMYKDVSFWDKEGRFVAKLSFNDALILLLKPNVDNIHYMQEYDIDLENYKLAGNIYKIEIA